MSLRYLPAATSAVVVILALADSPAHADDLEFGIRSQVSAANGEPANDIIATGVFVRYPLTDRWRIGFVFDHAQYDFERPWQFVGVQQSNAVGVVDATVKANRFGLWLQRDFIDSASSWRWYAGLGLSTASPEVSDASGPTDAGGTFDVRTDAGTETIMSIAAGVGTRLSDQWSWELAVRADHHRAHWQIRDRVSGATGSLGDYTALGLHASMAFRF